MRIVRTGLAAAALLAAATGFASAQTDLALVVQDLHFRAAPSVNSPSLGVIPGGSTIPAGPCGQGWCQTYLGGRTGFVSERYLDFGGPPPVVYAPAPPPPVLYGPPPYYVPAPPPYYHDRRRSRRW